MLFTSVAQNLNQHEKNAVTNDILALKNEAAIKESVKTISTKLEALKDLKAIEILNSLPSKYLS